ncbi:MAG TPA: hypothetical protein VKD47_08070 [Miltoncostaeaceae bacterium]|nr:hypothetical protein [Miltoncostaeaceae bacterium]
MIAASLSEYLPLGDLGKILVTALFVAVVAPTAVSLAIAGLDRRAEAEEHHTSPVAGIALIAAGVAVLAALIGIGLYSLIES